MRRKVVFGASLRHDKRCDLPLDKQVKCDLSDLSNDDLNFLEWQYIRGVAGLRMLTGHLIAG